MNEECRYILITGSSLVFILWILTFLGKKQFEPFNTMLPAHADVLLNRPVHFHLSNAKYGQLNKYRSSTPLASYEQITNNKKNWKNPENGSAMLPEINGTSFYS
jgi:hypothetical protein